jgi:hypothetical protein
MVAEKNDDDSNEGRYHYCILKRIDLFKFDFVYLGGEEITKVRRKAAARVRRRQMEAEILDFQQMRHSPKTRPQVLLFNATSPL